MKTQTASEASEGSAALQIIVVEDNPAFQLHIKNALTRFVHQHELFFFSLGSEALAFIEGSEKRGQKVDMALVDIGLPDMSGIDLIKFIRARIPGTPIIVISVVNTDAVLLDAIQSGARGYILKSETGASISHAISEVLAGNYPISPSLAKKIFKLLGAPDGREKDAEHDLTDREVEVLKMLARGLTYKETGFALKISISTVQSHVRSLYRKLDSRNRQQAVNNAREGGVL